MPSFFGDVLARLACALRGHVARRLFGTYYVVCDRCDATLNLRLATGRVVR